MELQNRRLDKSKNKTGSHTTSGNIAKQHSRMGINRFKKLEIIAAHSRQRNGPAIDVQITRLERRIHLGHDFFLHNRGNMHFFKVNQCLVKDAGKMAKFITTKIRQSMGKITIFKSFDTDLKGSKRTKNAS
ncbi:MAG: hypothetical protein ACD_39C01829G0001 [uncultured bacterium]|nr:MAG: hypothetical protein ACD_39C01829G0001 [uncultured bacterium]